METRTATLFFNSVFAPISNREEKMEIT